MENKQDTVSGKSRERRRKEHREDNWLKSKGKKLRKVKTKSERKISWGEQRKEVINIGREAESDVIWREERVDKVREESSVWRRRE